MGSFFAAAIQNLLANVNTVTQIQDKISAAQLIGDTVQVKYWYGRLANVILVFDPIPDDSFAPPVLLR